MTEPPSLLGGGDSQSTQLRRDLVITRHHVGGAKATYEVAIDNPKVGNRLVEHLP